MFELNWIISNTTWKVDLNFNDALEISLINVWDQVTVSFQTQNGIKCVTWRSLNLPCVSHPLLSLDLSLQVLYSSQHSLGCDAKSQNWGAVNLTRYWWFFSPLSNGVVPKGYSTWNIIMKPDFSTQNHGLTKSLPVWWSMATFWYWGKPALFLVFLTASQEDQLHLHLAHELSLFHTLYS